MKSDAQLKADIAAELEWDPEVRATDIGVMVKDGVVTLAGNLQSYSEKYAAERAVRRVVGVRGLALDLEVRLSPGHKRTDSEIATAAAAALALNSLVPKDKVQVEVEDGRITLTGEVEWNYEYASAEQSIRPLAGVRGVTNRITIRHHASNKDVAGQIMAAFTRQARREARHIGVLVEGAEVTLSGKVHSLAERDAAVGAALSTRGVSRVVDKLEIA